MYRVVYGVSVCACTDICMEKSSCKPCGCVVWAV